MITRQRYVMDTSAFTNAIESRDPRQVIPFIRTLVQQVSECRMKMGITCYIPTPTIYDELALSFRRMEAPDDIFTDLDTWFVKKTPNRYDVKISSQIFYEYISEIRNRVNKGLRVSEEHVRDAAKKKEHEPVITTLREKYKSALREGILDSKEDLDVLLLAKELDATVVSADEGIRKWAERLGLTYLEAKNFPKVLKEFLDSKA